MPIQSASGGLMASIFSMRAARLRPSISKSNAADDECRGDRHRREQVSLTVLINMTPRMAAGRNANSRFQVKSWDLRSRGSVAITVQSRDGTASKWPNGGELDDNFEDLAFLVVPIEKAADDDQVSGARYRQEFRQPFHYPSIKALIATIKSMCPPC